MKFLIINPNSDEATADVLRTTADAFLEGRAEADVVSLRTAPRLVVTYEDQAAATQELAEVIRTGRSGYDAFIIACHADPNLELARELADGRPVFGIAQASMHMAAMMSGGYAVITPSEKIVPKKFALARKYHCEDQLKAVVVSRGDDRESLLEAARAALQTPNVGGIVLGCANYSGAGGHLEEELKVPVYDGLIWALILVEGAVRSRGCQWR